MAARSTLTVVSGTTITSAWGNGVRDHAVPFTTSDDVSSNGQLAVNTSSSRLVTRLGGVNYPIAGAMPRVRIRTTTTLVLGALPALVPWDIEDYDTDGLWAPATSDFVVATRAGLYMATYQAYMEPTAAAVEKGAWMIVNGAGLWATSAVTTDDGFYATGTHPLALATGDTVGLMVRSSGGTVPAVGLSLTVVYLGPV